MVLDTLLLAGLGKEQIMQMLFIGAIIIIFYLFSIRPQRKKYAAHKNFLVTLKPGVQIVTIGGIHGFILNIDESTVTIEVNKKGASLVIDKNAISVEASSRYLEKNSTTK